MEVENLSQLVEDLRTEIDVAESEVDKFVATSVEERALDAAGNPRKAAGQYAVAAYTLGSTLFAYLRSEGSDPSKVTGELGRVRDELEKLKALSNKQ